MCRQRPARWFWLTFRARAYSRQLVTVDSGTCAGHLSRLNSRTRTQTKRARTKVPGSDRQSVSRSVGCQAGGWLPGYPVAVPPSPRRSCTSPREEGAPRRHGADVHRDCRRPPKEQYRWHQCRPRHPSAACGGRLVRLAALAGSHPRGARQRGRRFPCRLSRGTMPPPRRCTPGPAHRAPRRRRRFPGGTTGSHSCRERSSVGAGKDQPDSSHGTRLRLLKASGGSHSPATRARAGVRKIRTTPSGWPDLNRRPLRPEADARYPPS